MSQPSNAFTETVETGKTCAASVPGASKTSRASHASGAKATALPTLWPLLGVWVVWGAMYLFTRIALTGLPPYFLVAARFLTAGSLLLFIAKIRGESMPSLAQVRNAAIVGALLIGFGTSSTVFAQRWNTSGLASIIAATGSIWIALFSGFIGRWPKRLEWLGIGIGCVGVLVLSLGGLSAATLTPPGLFVGLFGTLCWSAGSVISQRLNLPDGIMRVACQMLAGGIVVSVISTIIHEPVSLSVSGRVWLAVGMLVAGAICGYGSYMYLLGLRQVSLATSYAYVNPVVAILLGAVILHERVDPVELIGIAIILAGVVAVWLGNTRGTVKRG